MLPNLKILGRVSNRRCSKYEESLSHELRVPHSARTPLVDVRGLRVSFARSGQTHVAVISADLQINSSEIVGVFGPSGSGKTSLGLALLNLLPATATCCADTLRFRDRDLLQLSEAEMQSIRGREISIIYQEPALALNPVMRVGDQIAEVIRAHYAISRRERRNRVWELLQNVRLDQRQGIYDAYPHELSGGERHRIVIAQALACHPFLVIADEPTAGLDAELKPEIMDLIGRLRTELKVSFLLISHDRKMLAQVADRTLKMSAGRLQQPSVDLLPIKPSSRVQLDRAFKAGLRDDRPLITVRNLSKSYRPRAGFGSDLAVPVLREVNLEIRRGSILGLRGPSGSGKSTLARCLALWETIDAGAISFCQKSITDLCSDQARQTRQRIQLVLQDSAAAFNPNLTAEEIVEEPLVIRSGSTRQQRRTEVRRLLRETGLEPETYVHKALELSGGQRQRLAIARALIVNPELIIFDESTTGLDRETQQQIVALLQALKRARNLTYLFISHDLDFLKQIAEEVAVMSEGTIVRRQPVEEAVCAADATCANQSLQAHGKPKPVAVSGAR